MVRKADRFTTITTSMPIVPNTYFTRHTLLEHDGLGLADAALPIEAGAASARDPTTTATPEPPSGFPSHNAFREACTSIT